MLTGWQPIRRCLDHTDPFQDLDNLRAPGSRQGRRGWVPHDTNPESQQQIEWVPESRFDDSHQGYIITVNIPTVPKDQVQIRVGHQTIELRIDAPDLTTENMSKTGEATFEKSINLPEDAELNEIIATFQEGSIRFAVGKKSNRHSRYINLRFQ